MKQKIKTYWFDDIGVAQCNILYKTASGIEITGFGEAICHEEDMPFKSRLTGSNIAQYRAEIDLIKQINKYEIKPEIVSLKHVYCTMINSKRYNPNAYEAIRLKKELAHRMDELEDNKNLIISLNKELQEYIDQKNKIQLKIKEGQI